MVTDSPALKPNARKMTNYFAKTLNFMTYKLNYSARNCNYKKSCLFCRGMSGLEPGGSALEHLTLAKRLFCW